MGTHTWRASASVRHRRAEHQSSAIRAACSSTISAASPTPQNLAVPIQQRRPNQITENLLPIPVSQRARYDAVYAQEQWTLRQADAAGRSALRPGGSYFPRQQVGPTRFLHDADLSSPKPTGVDSYKDISPRGGVAYDVFGNGKTSIKVNTGRYLEAAQNGGNYSGPRPDGRITTTATRDVDRLRTATSSPTAMLTNPPGATTECRADFGPELRHRHSSATPTIPGRSAGWGVRGADWQFGVHRSSSEFLPRCRSRPAITGAGCKNFFVTDNLASRRQRFRYVQHHRAVRFPAARRRRQRVAGSTIRIPTCGRW